MEIAEGPGDLCICMDVSTHLRGTCSKRVKRLSSQHCSYGPDTHTQPSAHTGFRNRHTGTHFFKVAYNLATPGSLLVVFLLNLPFQKKTKPSTDGMPRFFSFPHLLSLLHTHPSFPLPSFPSVCLEEHNTRPLHFTL